MQNFENSKLLPLQKWGGGGSNYASVLNILWYKHYPHIQSEICNIQFTHEQFAEQKKTDEK